ncbi:NADPH:quinone oxidoreductase family protein [Microbulbifer hainanensis]|uniref:NADPH:quinone oxidoreductase family protein n=1 Tax=Microbulbifer hainanensis TaxID=2735675 RepID=UPI0018671FB1|nr:NADPH:quinone oxidoreductase family protein [Microbulbifer hainanensis]
MKAILCEEYGPIENLRYTDLADPEAGRGEVRVAVKAVGVNYPDALLVQGLYQVKPQLPFVPGPEFSGVVDQVGEGGSWFNVGDRVLAFSPELGGCAEKVIVKQNMLVPIPSQMPYIDAANLLCAHGTAHHALKQRAQLQAGETLVVLGAAGGTGLAAVQIGKAMGARVIAVCSSASKLAVARENGADELINYSEQDLKQTIHDFTSGRGADVVFDPVGGDAFDSCTRVMARNGRLLVVGFASGRIPKLPVNLALVKEYSVMGVFWGSFATHEPETFAENMREMMGWYSAGKIRVVTEEVLPLKDTAVALQRLMDRKVTGKLALEV